MTNWEPTRADKTPKVRGPIHCHTCRLICCDAEHYLSHKCEPKLPAACIVFSLLASREPR